MLKVWRSCRAQIQPSGWCLKQHRVGFLLSPEHCSALAAKQPCSIRLFCCSSLTGDPRTQLRDTLFTACKTGDVGTLQHLLGVPEGRGPLEDSEDGEDAQHLDLPRSLLNQPLDEDGFTLLHVAARAGKAEAVRLLLEAGADPALR